MNVATSLAALHERMDALAAAGDRRIIGLVGAPGSGKSTLAEQLFAHAPERSTIVPMDGFHLANVELARLGRSRRKGAENTFDSAGYVALLRRLRAQPDDEIVYAPLFRREIEEPIFAHTPLIITEGNYLLLDRGHWAAVRALIDEIWYVDVDDALRVQRLIARHVRFGRTEPEARRWVAATDEPNALLIASTRSRADLRVAIAPSESGG